MNRTKLDELVGLLKDGGRFYPIRKHDAGAGPDTFLKHRAIGFYEKHGGRSGTCPA